MKTPEERLSSAMAGMFHAQDSKIKSLKLAHDIGVDNFLTTVGKLKEFLFPGILLYSAKHYLDMTRVRVQLEKVFSPEYISKPHLAVALVELGIQVRYDNSFYFSSPIKAAKLLNQLDKHGTLYV